MLAGGEAVDAADVRRLLADRQVAVAADPRARVLLLRTLFETPDEQHQAQQTECMLSVLEHVARPIGCLGHCPPSQARRDMSQESRIHPRLCGWGPGGSLLDQLRG